MAANAGEPLGRGTVPWRTSGQDNPLASPGKVQWQILARGANSALLPNHIIAPEGRIFFAGEHASLSHTWMQGALESGLRAVEEMLTVP